MTAAGASGRATGASGRTAALARGGFLVDADLGAGSSATPVGAAPDTTSDAIVGNEAGAGTTTGVTSIARFGAACAGTLGLSVGAAPAELAGIADGADLPNQRNAPVPSSNSVAPSPKPSRRCWFGRLARLTVIEVGPVWVEPDKPPVGDNHVAGAVAAITASELMGPRAWPSTSKRQTDSSAAAASRIE